MKKIFVIIVLFFVISLPSYSAEKVVYLDVEKIMQQSSAGKSIISQLQKRRDISVSNFKKREKEIFEKEKKLISQKNVLSQEEFEKKLKGLRVEITNYQKDRNKKVNEINKSRINSTTKLLKKLTPILEDYSNKNSIRIIVQKKNIVMGKKEDDITKDILDLVNQKIKNIKID